MIQFADSLTEYQKLNKQMIHFNGSAEIESKKKISLRQYKRAFIVFSKKSWQGKGKKVLPR